MSKATGSAEAQVGASRRGDATNVVRVDFHRRSPPIIAGPGWYHDEAIREERAARTTPPR